MPSLTGLLRAHRLSAMLAVSAGVLAAFLEGTTLVLLLLALSLLAGSASMEGMPTPLGMWLSSAGQRLSLDGLFIALVVAAVVLQALRGVSVYAGRAAAGHVRLAAEAALRARIFERFVSMSLLKSSQHGLGEKMSYIDQVRYAGMALETMLQLVCLALLIAAYVVILCWLSWPATLAVLLLLALFAWPIRYAMRRLHRISQRIVDIEVRLKADLADRLSGLRIIHAYVRESTVRAEVGALIDESTRVRRRNYLMYLSINPVFETLAVIGAALLIIIAYTSAGIESIPRLLAFVFVLYRLMPRVLSINNMVGALNIARPYVARVDELLTIDDKLGPVTGRRQVPALRSGIAFRNVCFLYPHAEQRAVERLSFVLRRGTTTALAGASGSGKSTVANLLLRFFDPTRGEITVDGIALCEYAPTAWRRVVGIVEQDPFLFHGTVYENIAFGMENATCEAVEEAARLANANDFIARLPQGFHTVVGERGLRLSGGERQRIAIARAVIGDPQVLIMDEATSSLDSLSERLIQESLRQLRRERTLLVIAHRLSTVTMADNILVLDGGRLVEQGTHEQLLAQGEAYARLWQIQTVGGRHAPASHEIIPQGATHEP